MCGIVGFTGRENALPILIKGLYSLEYRGYDSAGVAAFTKDGLRVVKARGRIANLEEKIKEEGGDMYCTCGIGHTRWATHGEPSDRNSHPHLGGKGKVAVVHNGIIENYKELRERLEAHGYEFKSETDTETVAHLVDYLHTGKQEDLAKTVLQAVQRLRGSYALGVVSMDNTQEIVAARRGNPLVIGIGEGENMIASDITAIINRTKRYIILDDNEVELLVGYRGYYAFFSSPKCLYAEDDPIHGTWKIQDGCLIIEITQDNIFDGKYTKLVFRPLDTE